MLSHITHLPPESAFARARNGEAAAWTQAVELAATQVDVLQLLLRTYINANSEQKITDPYKPYPRPAAISGPPAPEETVNLSGFADFLKG